MNPKLEAIPNTPMPKDTEHLSEAGSFEVTVQEPTAGWFGESGEKQTPYIRLPLLTDDGKFIAWYGWLSERATDNTVARLAEAFGFDGDFNALYKGKTTLAGKRCNITTEMEEYNGKTRCKVAFLNPSGGSAPKPMEEAKVLSLLAKVTPRAKAVAKATPKPTPQPPAPVAPTPPVDDDVPF